MLDVQHGISGALLPVMPLPDISATPQLKQLSQRQHSPELPGVGVAMKRGEVGGKDVELWAVLKGSSSSSIGCWVAFIPLLLCRQMCKQSFEYDAVRPICTITEMLPFLILSIKYRKETNTKKIVYGMDISNFLEMKKARVYTFVAVTKYRPKGQLSAKERLKRRKKKSRFQTAQIKKFVITTKLWSKPTHSGPCRLGDLTKPSLHFWRPSCKKCHLMNLSAEAVPCLSEVSASDKRLGPPPPVTDRPASWRLRPQSNHATRTGPALCAWSVTLWAEGARRGWVEGESLCDQRAQPFVSMQVPPCRLIRNHRRMRQTSQLQGDLSLTHNSHNAI